MVDAGDVPEHIEPPELVDARPNGGRATVRLAEIGLSHLHGARRVARQALGLGEPVGVDVDAEDGGALARAAAA